MPEFVVRNQFRLPVNPIDVGLRWGREGYTCESHQAPAWVLATAGTEEAAKPPAKRDVVPPQILLSRGFFGHQSPAKPPRGRPAIATVLEAKTRGDHLIAVALSGGLAALVEGQLFDLFPGDELRVPAGLECELGIMTATTRWLHGFRR